MTISNFLKMFPLSLFAGKSIETAYWRPFKYFSRVEASTFDVLSAVDHTCEIVDGKQVYEKEEGKGG